jgi:hypothetical protein
MAIDHAGEALIGFEALPFEAGAPVVEEAPGPALAVVVPELAEGLLQNIGGVQPFVGGEQQRERAPALEREILAGRDRSVYFSKSPTRFPEEPKKGGPAERGCPVGVV